MTKLSVNIDIERLEKLISNKDRIAISDFVFNRFMERYIMPIKALSPKDKHGFSIMAVSCLMIESIASFMQGLEDTNGKSRKVFGGFLSSEPEFFEFKGFEDEFYFNVRCGILHQSETTDGWKITRKGVLFDVETKTVNATLFLIRLEKVLQNYADILKHKDWDTVIWNNLIRKLKYIISNC